MRVLQARLDERERPSCVKEAEVSSSSPFMKTAGKFDYVCVSLYHIDIIKKNLKRIVLKFLLIRKTCQQADKLFINFINAKLAT